MVGPRVGARTHASRALGNVTDLVGALIFLCSPASGFVNGQIVFMDGGMLSVV